MSKYANSGELRTPIRIVDVEKATDATGRYITNDNGYPIITEKDVFERPVLVKWVNAHGTEVFEAQSLNINEPATITMRYSPKVNATQLIYKGADPRPYEIIGMDNVEERNTWLEIKVKRKSEAR